MPRSLSQDAPEKAAERFQKLPMIRWYQPLLLLRTGIRALLATVIGQISDNRELQALDRRDQGNQWDYTKPPSVPSSETTGSGELWIDFVADVGDGWDPSFAVAQAVASDHLTVDGYQLPRGSLLLFGGDLVYPDPSIEAYQSRTLAPYNAACEAVNPFQADVFAVPGNHDWYDGLHAFQDIFCHDLPTERERPLGSWRKVQSHSYFAWQLPHGWWLLAPDVQLDNRLNPSQRSYFRRIASQMTAGDRVIIAAPFPHWSLNDPNAQGAVLRWLAELCNTVDAHLKLVLTGDLHHYSRFSESLGEEEASDDETPASQIRAEPAEVSGLQLVTAGGGGAFLHPTHTLSDEVELTGLGTGRHPHAKTFRRQSIYPKASISHRLSLRNLLFPVTNWELSLFVGFVYTMLAWVLETRLLIGTQSVSDLFEAVLISHGGIGQTLTQMITMIPKSPEFALVVVLTALGLTAFNENCTRRTRILLGALHTMFHLVGLILTFCVAIEVTGWMYNQFETLSFSFFWFLLIMIGLGGGVGGVVIGLYLMLSLNLFGANLTNAFSSLRIVEHKNFVRLKVDSEGHLTVYPLGIKNPKDEQPDIALIEKPFIIS